MSFRRNRRSRWRVAGLLAVALVASACVVGSASGGDQSVVVFAAASLRDAAAAAADEYRSAAGVTITLSTDSSTALRVQIEQGARADVFLSADAANPAALAEAGLADGNPVPFAGNRLAIVVPRANPARIASPFDLGRPGVKVVAAGDAVPITAYAIRLVERLATLPGAPADFVSAYSANVVSREDNVRAALAKIELGEGDAAIVYATDAAASSTVSVIDVPAAANVVATYAGVVPRTAGRPAAGRALLDWLTGADGQAVLSAFGFTAPP